MADNDKAQTDDMIQGEGDYDASRRFQKEARGFGKTSDVEGKAR